jgi:hypothetical protein
MRNGHKQRYDNGYNQIDENGIGGETCRIAAQFHCHYGAGRGGRADEAEHCALDDEPPRSVGDEMEYHCQRSERYGLYQTKPKIPCAKVQVGGLHFAECEEQHAEDEQRLDVAYRFVRQGFGACQKWQIRIDKISCHTCKHGDRQRPVFYESYDLLHDGCKINGKFLEAVQNNFLNLQKNVSIKFRNSF